jgi:glycosyltransferase involved in cell wall biosynthesis
MQTDFSSSEAVDMERENSGLPTYVLITPARNEAAYIEQTLKSMAGQTIPPVRWVIVSDGSTDGTDDIVRKYTAEHAWIELVRMPVRPERHFAGKVHAFNAGYSRVMDLKYDIIGNLDADISFGEDHFEFLLGKFAEQPLLGVAGTAFIEGSSLKYDYNLFNLEDVEGQCQIFRRKCFEEIGGYVPIKNGGIDVIPVYLARMKGWKTWTFTEKTYVHHRISGTGQGSHPGAFFRSGKKDYYLGGHPLWEILRCLYQMKAKPYIAGGLLLLAGYVWEFLRGAEYPVPAELIAFRRKEQMRRLRGIFRKLISFKKVSPLSDRSPDDSLNMRY